MGKLRNLFVKNDKTHRYRDKISVKFSFLYLILILLIELWLSVGFYLFIFNSVISSQEIVIHYQLFKDDYIVSMNRIEKDGKIWWTVYLFLETKPLRQTLLQIGLVFLLLLLLTFILTAISPYYLSRKITKPLLELKDTTEKIAIGALGLTTDIHPQDEIGD